MGRQLLICDQRVLARHTCFLAKICLVASQAHRLASNQLLCKGPLRLVSQEIRPKVWFTRLARVSWTVLLLTRSLILLIYRESAVHIFSCWPLGLES